MARLLAPCGTDSAYKRHLRNGEPTCQPCRQAHRETQRDRRARREQERRVAAELEPLPVADPADPVFSDDDEPDWQDNTESDADAAGGDEPDRLGDLLQVREDLLAAIATARRSDPLKIAPLVRELRAVWRDIEGSMAEDAEEADPFDEFLDDAPDDSNVVGFPNAQDRVQA